MMLLGWLCCSCDPAVVKRILRPKNASLAGARRRGTDRRAAAEAAGPDPPGPLIDVAQVQAGPRPVGASRRRDGERNPNETASIVRQWLRSPRPDMAVRKNTNHNDINTVIVNLASRQEPPKDQAAAEARRDHDAGARRTIWRQVWSCSTTTKCANCRCKCRRSARRGDCGEDRCSNSSPHVGIRP